MGVDAYIMRLAKRHPDFPEGVRGGARAFDHHINWGDDDPTGCSGNGIHIECDRPVDFAKARDWVYWQFPEPSETRDWYLRALDVMERDDAVCIHFSR